MWNVFEPPLWRGGKPRNPNAHFNFQPTFPSGSTLIYCAVASWRPKVISNENLELESETFSPRQRGSIAQFVLGVSHLKG